MYEDECTKPHLSPQGGPGWSQTVPYMKPLARTSQDIPNVPDVEAVYVMSQSPRSKMSWDILVYPRMSKPWRHCKVPGPRCSEVSEM